MNIYELYVVAGEEVVTIGLFSSMKKAEAAKKKLEEEHRWDLADLGIIYVGKMNTVDENVIKTYCDDDYYSDELED